MSWSAWLRSGEKWAAYSQTALHGMLTELCYRVEERPCPGPPWTERFMVKRWDGEPNAEQEATLVEAVDLWVAAGIEAGLRQGNLALRMHALLYDAPKALDVYRTRCWPFPSCAISRIVEWQDRVRRFPLR